MQLSKELPVAPVVVISKFVISNFVISNFVISNFVNSNFVILNFSSQSYFFVKKWRN